MRRAAARGGGRHRVLLRGPGPGARSATPRAILVIDPVDGTRPAAAGLESCCVSVAVVPPTSTRRSARCRSASCTSSRPASASSPTRGEGVAHRGAGRRRRSRSRCRTNTDLDALFWTAGLRGRPSLPMSVVLEELVDRSGMRGGYFDLGSATFNITRIVTGQLDAYVDVGRRVLDEFPRPRPRSWPSATARLHELPVRRRGRGADPRRGRGGDHPRRRAAARRPPGGRARAGPRASRCSRRPRPSSTPRCSRRSTGE